MRNLTRRVNCFRWYIFDLNHYETTVCLPQVWYQHHDRGDHDLHSLHSAGREPSVSLSSRRLRHRPSELDQCTSSLSLSLSLLSLFGTFLQNWCAISLNLLSLFPLLTLSLRTGPMYVFPVSLSLSPFPSLAPSFRTGVPSLRTGPIL